MSIFHEAARVASRQHGLITAAQLRSAGLSARNVRTLRSKGLLERHGAGIYVVAGTRRTWEQRTMALVIAAGPLALSSHRSASGLWRLDRFRRQHADLITPHPAMRRPTAAKVHETNDLASRDRTVVEGIPVTTPVRTIVDMGRYVSAERLGEMLDDAVRRNLTTYREAQLRFAELAGRGRDGVATVRETLASRPEGAAVPDSPLETDVRALLVRAGLPEPVLHQRVECDEITYVLDLAWPDQLVAVECDGFRFHRMPGQLDWDDRRRNALGVRGWLVLHTTRGMLRSSSGQLARNVSRALRDREHPIC